MYRLEWGTQGDHGAWTDDFELLEAWIRVVNRVWAIPHWIRSRGI